MKETLILENPIKRTVLKNGITLITAENTSADIIAARIFIKAGGRWENPEKAGVFNLLSRVLTKGTENLSSLQIADMVESIGASLNADTTSDYFLMSLKTVSNDFADILQLAGELLRFPSFPLTQVELEKRLTLNDIRSQKEQPFSVGFDKLRQVMYQNHPYSFSSLGTEKTISQLTQSDLKYYHQTFFRPDNIVISIAGKIPPDDAIDLVDKVFGSWQKPNTPLPKLSLPEVTTNPCWILNPIDTQQSLVMLGYLCGNVNNSDYGTLKLLNTYLGNGLSSRLFVELREKRGLAYEVSAFYPTRLDQAQFVVYMGTSPDNTKIAYEGLKAEIDRLCHVRLSDTELLACKNKLLGQYALGKQTNSQIAQIFGWYEILGLGIQFDIQFQSMIADVSAKMCEETAKKYFNTPYVSLVGPEAKINIV